MEELDAYLGWYPEASLVGEGDGFEGDGGVVEGEKEVDEAEDGRGGRGGEVDSEGVKGAAWEVGGEARGDELLELRVGEGRWCSREG